MSSGMYERLRVAVETNGYRQTGAVTASFGVVQLAETESVEALLGRADERLYAAKSQGRNQVG